MAEKIRVTIWNEYRHEVNDEDIAKLYPKGIHGQIASFLSEEPDMEVRTATLDEPDHGIPDAVLDDTDVLLWWGHMNHGDVRDDRVEYIRHRVYTGGMGFIALHSGHHSKPFRALVGATGNLSWGDNQHEILWNLKPSHPIAAGIPDHFHLEEEELYAEPFYIPNPDDLILGGWFEQGYIFRSCCTFTRGVGKIVYLQPGHESVPTYYNPYIQRIIKNAVRWARPNDFGYEIKNEAPYVTSALEPEEK